MKDPKTYDEHLMELRKQAEAIDRKIARAQSVSVDTKRRLARVQRVVNERNIGSMIVE